MTAHGLEEVVVLSVRKSFWASREAEVFPRRVYSPALLGRPSWSLLNSLGLALAGLREIRGRPTRLIVIGSAHRLAPWLAALRRWRILRANLVITNLKELPAELYPYVDRIIEYSTREIEARPPSLRERCVFMPLPADGDFAAVRAREPGGYVFAGGGSLRDFPSLIEAVRGVDVTVRIVTYSREHLGYTGQLPANCDVRFQVPLAEFLDDIAGSSFVAMPLQRGTYSHGQTTVVQALRLGKAVVTTRDASVEDYVRDGREGLLVEPGDVAGYRDAIVRLVRDDELRRSCERAALERAKDLTYSAFAHRLVAL